MLNRDWSSSMEKANLSRIIEGILLASGRPINVAKLLELFDKEDRLQASEIRDALKTIESRHSESGFELKEVASGFRFQIRSELAPWIAKLWQDRPQKYSRALLETLSLIAYRQPITRGEIEEIRGVSLSSSILRTLHEREWVRVVGHRDVPGRPALYATTRLFLDYFSLKSLDQLPVLADVAEFESLTKELELDETGEFKLESSQVSMKVDIESISTKDLSLEDEKVNVNVVDENNFVG